MPQTLQAFEIGDTVIYRNPDTRIFEQVLVTGIDRGERGIKFTGRQMNSPLESFFQRPVYVVGARAENVEDVIKA